MKKTITIFSNYDTDAWREDAIETLYDNEVDEPTEEQIYDEIYFMQENVWEDEFYQLKKFFSNKKLIVVGTIGRWNGTFFGGKIFDGFKDAFYSMTEDCNYFKLEDNNGKMFLTCSHHDGTNNFEIKILSKRGENLIDNWEYDYSDKRTEKEIHSIIMNSNLFSTYPWYAKNFYGI